MLSDEENKNYDWFPDEEICRKKKGIPDWVKQQRKVAKKAEPDNFWHYFTLDMLKVRFRVTKKVKGIDPNIDQAPQLKKWFKRYKGITKRKISDKLRKVKRKAIAIAQEEKKKLQMNPALESGSSG